MRDSMADKHFQFAKSAELLLSEKYPQDIISHYSMVSFTSIPYSEAKLKGEIIFEAVLKNCEGISKIEDFDVDKTYKEIMVKFKELNFV